MSRECQSMIIEQDENNKQANILRAISEYEQICESEQQEDTNTVKEDCSLQGFQNKRSLKIKPVNMFKDQITLRKENAEKKQQVRALEQLNTQLRNQYDGSLKDNARLESFLKEVEFTFQQDSRKTKASEILLRARRMLFQEAREAKQRMKRMFKSSDASEIQQLKQYIAVLEGLREQLKKKVAKKKYEVAMRVNEEDLNIKQIKHYEQGCEKVKTALNSEVEKMKQRYEDYKTEKMEIKNKLKMRDLEAKKKYIKEEIENVRRLSLQSEGLQYEIQLLKHRVKDRKKEQAEYEQLKETIYLKHAIIIRQEKELREKNKTFDYMLQWTKELKKQLEGKKKEHGDKKTKLEEEINTLSELYEKHNQQYKAGLFEEQVARRKGPRDPEPQNQTITSSLGRQVNLGEIKFVLKSLSFELFCRGINNNQFIENILRISEPKLQLPQRQYKRVKLKSALSIDASPSKDSITLRQLIDNFQRLEGLKLSKQVLVKIARFIVQDGSGKAEENASVPTSIARQVLRKMLERQLQNADSVIQATVELRKLLSTHYDGIRHQLKIAGGKEEEIEVSALQNIFLRFGAQSYQSSLFTELLELIGWKKRSKLGIVKLEDYDETLVKLKSGNDQVFLSLIKH